MAHILTATVRPAVQLPRRFEWGYFTDDPLGAMRGIIFSTLASALVFWLPLAFYFWG